MKLFRAEQDRRGRMKLVVDRYVSPQEWERLSAEERGRQLYLRYQRYGDAQRRKAARVRRKALFKTLREFLLAVVVLLVVLLVGNWIGNLIHGIPPDAMCAGTGEHQKCMRRIAICAEATTTEYYDECVKSVVDNM